MKIITRTEELLSHSATQLSGIKNPIAYRNKLVFYICSLVSGPSIFHWRKITGSQRENYAVSKTIFWPA